jgi:hypothetical protein
MQLASSLSLAVGSRGTGNFLRGRLRPAVRRATEAVVERGVREALQTTQSYMTGLWARLNGQLVSSACNALPLGMPVPLSKSGVCHVLRYREQLPVVTCMTLLF